MTKPIFHPLARALAAAAVAVLATGAQAETVLKLSNQFPGGKGDVRVVGAGVGEPAPADRASLRRALREGVIDVISTDHAPHLLTEKEGGCLKAASGMPMVQFSLVAMLELAREHLLEMTQSEAFAPIYVRLADGRNEHSSERSSESGHGNESASAE